MRRLTGSAHLAALQAAAASANQSFGSPRAAVERQPPLSGMLPSFFTSTWTSSPGQEPVRWTVAVSRDGAYR